MKHAILICLLTCAAMPGAAQWKDAHADAFSIHCFGVHDTSLFASIEQYVYLYVPTDPDKWIRKSTGLDFSQGVVTSFASLGRYFFAGMTRSGGGPGEAWRSSDDGSHWIANAGGNVCSNGYYVFCVSDGTYRSTDSGNTNTWVKVANFVATNFAASGVCILAGVYDGVWRSTDTGNNWTHITYPAGVSSSVLAFLASNLFAGGTGVSLSSDSGKNWKQVGLTNRKVHALAVSGTNLFAGTDSGVFVSVDSGANWRNVSDVVLSRGNDFNTTLLVVFDTFLFAAVDISPTNGSHVAMRPISEMVPPKSAVQEKPLAADTLAIYPNPATGVITIFAGSTTIERVSVLSVLGVEMLTLDKPGGMSYNSEITLDLSQLPSGTYFLRIVTAEGSVLRKVIHE
jgi:hypothetical protein